MEMYKIYTLKDPNTLQIRYIGATCKKLQTRLSNHIYYAKKRNCTHVHNWILNLLTNEKKPIIELLEIVTKETWEEREIYWIAFYKKTGLLTNIREGGKGLIVDRSFTSREKSAAAKSIAIIQCDTNNNYIAEFSSITLAAKAFNTGHTNIGNVLSGKNKTACGYKWFYKVDYESINFKPNITSNSKTGAKRKITRHNLETNEKKIYNSLTQAAKLNNMNTSSLCSLIKTNKPICIFKFNYS